MKLAVDFNYESSVSATCWRSYSYPTWVVASDELWNAFICLPLKVLSDHDLIHHISRMETNTLWQAF